MKTVLCKRVPLFIAFLFFMQPLFSQSTGRVVINEYMPWTSNGCRTTSEFVELLNFGPGPVDIGCYILTTGIYSITIPPNTILQPGEFYVLAGQNFIPGSCANIDSSATGITANLNWNLCNCTNIPIPTTGDGMMTDGGSSNTPLVLLDTRFTVIDAVVRSLPAEPSTVITSATIPRGCVGRIFNLGQMPVAYETLGMSAGRGNSFARRLDGDCGWLKEPQQSGNASNNHDGIASDISYEFNLLNATNCNGLGGKVAINVRYSDYASIFPMTYTIALDSNKNGMLDMDDQYATLIDSTPSSIEINGLSTGHYKITVASAKGCYLKTFEFSILDCYPVLPVKLDYFNYAGRKNGFHQLQWKLHEIENLQTTIVQKAEKDKEFVTDKIIQEPAIATGSKLFSTEVSATGLYQYFRLKMITKNGEAFYSPVIAANTISQVNKIGPNPVFDKLNLQLTSASARTISYTIHNVYGETVQKGSLQVSAGQTTSSLDLALLATGVYQLQLTGLSNNGQPISFRFVKH